MRILVVCDGGLGKGFAQRCERDGHDVKVSRPDMAQWRPDLVIYDNWRNYAKEADSLRTHGIKVLGPSRWSQTLEEDKEYLSQIIAAIGWPSNGVPQGTHLYLSGWFNGASFISTYTSVVYRRFMAGGAGPDLTCTGMLSCFEPLTNQTYRTLLAPIEKTLKKVNHRGVVHIHALVNGPVYCVKEIITSFAHPLSLTLFENTFQSTSEIILSLFDENSKKVKTLSAWAAGLQLSVPPYPYNYGNEYHSVEGIVPGNIKHLWAADLEQEGDKYASGGLIGYVTARGHDENESVRRMYRTVGNLRSADMQYRNDVGRNIQPLLMSLKQGGWI